MKGLIIKDLYMLVKYFKLYFLLDVIFIAAALISPDNVSFLAIPVLVSGIVPLTLLAYDERSKWLGYSGTLPYSRSQIVSEKYIFGLLMQSAMCVLLFCLLLAVGAFHGEFDPAASAVMVLGMFAVALLFPSVCLPLCFALGVEKGRIAYIVMVGAITAAGAIFVNKVDNAESAKGFLTTEIPPFIWVVIVMIYALSWLLSTVIYNKKETGNA